jgi:hypothetical protein
MDLSSATISDLKNELLRRKDNPEFHDKVRVLVGQWAAENQWASKVLYAGTSDLESSMLAVVSDGEVDLDRRRAVASLGLLVGYHLGPPMTSYCYDQAAVVPMDWVEVFSKRPSTR